MSLKKKTAYSFKYYSGKGEWGFEYKSWRTPKGCIRNVLEAKKHIEETYGEECTVTCEWVPAHESWNIGDEFIFRISLDECNCTPGFQKIESFTNPDGAQHVNFYRYIQTNKMKDPRDYHGSHVFSREEWERVAPPARD